MNNKKFTKYLIEANRKAKQYRFYINESLRGPVGSIILEVYDVDNNYQNRIILTDGDIELYTEPIEITGRTDELEDYYIRHYVK